MTFIINNITENGTFQNPELSLPQNCVTLSLKVAGMLSGASFDFVRCPLQIKHIVSSAW